MLLASDSIEDLIIRDNYKPNGLDLTLALKSDPILREPGIFSYERRIRVQLTC